MIFLPVKNLGKAFHNIDNDFITEKEFALGNVKNLIKSHPTNV